MGLAAHNDSAASAHGSGSVATTIAASTGDLIAVLVSNLIAGTYCTGVTDTIGNSYTVRSAVSADVALVWAYCLSSTGTNENNVITATFNNATEDRKQIIASSWTVDSGDTVTMEDAANKVGAWQASPWETASDLTTTGTDELVIAGFQANGSTVTFTNHEIPSGTAATVLTAPGYGATGFYRILTATITNEEAEVDPSAANKYSAEMLAFKSTAGGGGISIPVVMLQHDHFNGGAHGQAN